MKPEKNDKIEQADIKHKHTRGPFQNYQSIIMIIIIFYTLGIKDPEGFWKKIDTKEKIVEVTITP